MKFNDQFIFSSNDWGYRFTVTAIKPNESKQNLHWLANIDYLLADVKTALATSFFSAVPWDSVLEDVNESWLADPLLVPRTQSNASSLSTVGLVSLGTSPNDISLFIDSLAPIMKPLVQTDQGSDVDINQAVYTTCIALIVVNGLTSEAVALANGIRKAPSQAILRAWTAGKLT